MTASAARAAAPAWLRALRPRQWTKNAAVYAPLLFARAVFVPGAALHATLAFLAFCLLASGVYVLNDWRDRAVDRLHPEKRHRPLASGALGGRPAVALAAACWCGGIALAWAASPGTARVAAVYLGLQTSYSFWLKRVVILDVLVISAGFVLRVLGGAEAIDVPVSNWLFLCALLLALFLALAKRRHELAVLERDAAAHRSALGDYSLPLLDQMLGMVAATCVVAYGLYTVAPDTIHKVGSDRLKWTLPFVLYGILRYLFLIHRRGAGGSPERVLFSDGPMLVDLCLYVAVAAAALYG